MPFVVRWKTVAAGTSASTCCGSGGAKETTIPDLTSFATLKLFAGVIRFDAPRSSSAPHRAQFFRSFRHFRSSAGVSEEGLWVCPRARTNEIDSTPDKSSPTATSSLTPRLMVPSIQKSRLANAQTQANHIHPSQVSSNWKSDAERRQQGAMILVAPASRRRLALS